MSTAHPCLASYLLSACRVAAMLSDKRMVGASRPGSDAPYLSYNTHKLRNCLVMLAWPISQ